MIEEIKKLCNNKELVEIYNDVDDNTFYVCNIEACSDDHLLLLCYDRKGQSCGYKVIRTDSVASISYDTIYLKDQQRILANNAADYRFPVGYWNDLEIMDVFLNMCIKNKLMTGIELLDGRTRNGYIVAVDEKEDILKIKAYDFTGNYDGMCIVRLSYVKMAEIDGEDQLRIVRYINANQ